MIHGRHPSGVDYSVLHEAKPLEIAFESIKWPEHLKLPWVKTDAAVVEERDGEPFVITDRGTVIVNQMYFVRKYTLEYHVLYDAGVSDFYQYDPDSGLWKRVTVESIKRAFLDDFATVARTANLPQVFLKRTDGFVNGLVALLKSTAEKCNAFTERPHAIHVKNGMICFDDEGATLKTFHPDYLSRNQCPHAFDPQADCPRFIKELLESAMSRDDASLLQRWAGACLLGHNAAQRFLMLLGTPGGGKSTVMAIIEQMIGLQNVAQLRTEQLSERFELYSFVGKQLLIGKDVSSNFLMQKGAYMLKALVGHDTLEAEKKNANERIKINGDFNVGITCNADLNIRLQGDAGAWRRRMMVIRYENEPPKKRIPDFAEQLLAQEGPGILKWMVEGAMDLLDDLEQYGDYYLTDPQKEQINRLMDQSDSVRRFVQEGVVPRKGASITTEDLISAYYEFCDNRQWAPFPVRELRAGLAKYMLEIHRLNSRNDIPRGEKVARGFKHVAVVNGGLE